ncbi:MAG: hypothetical protein RL108_67 [Bacteroidota bacterium]|jgi:hypothetical protein
MVLDEIKKQESYRWHLDEVLIDRLVYRSNFISDPFASIEFVLKPGNANKVFVLFKGEDNKAGMEMFFQKELCVEKYLTITDNMSDMVFEFII